MPVNYFGNRSSSNSDSPFYKLKNILLPNRTNIAIGSTYLGIPVYRSAVANNTFKFPTASTVTLNSITSAGGETVVATVDVTSVLASGVVACVHLNSTDQCLYLLVAASGTTFQLMKVSDSTGVLTGLGSSFTPANPTRWVNNRLGTSARGTMFIDGSSHIRVYMNGYYHQINKTTGAIVTQDTAVAIGSYNLKNTAYVNAAGTIATQFPQTGGVSGDQGLRFQAIHAVSSGIITDFNIEVSKVFEQRQSYVGSDFVEMIIVDSDKIYFGDLGTGGNSKNFGYYNISDFDQCLQSIVDWYSGA